MVDTQKCLFQIDTEIDINDKSQIVARLKNSILSRLLGTLTLSHYSSAQTIAFSQTLLPRAYDRTIILFEELELIFV